MDTNTLKYNYKDVLGKHANSANVCTHVTSLIGSSLKSIRFGFCEVSATVHRVYVPNIFDHTIVGEISERR